MLSRIHVRTKTFLALRNLNWFSAVLWFIVCFKSALRVHYLPLCLLENHYGAIKSNVVHTETWDFPPCLMAVHFLCASCEWFVHLWRSRDTVVAKTLNRWQLQADASSFWMYSLTLTNRDFHKWWCATDSLEAMWVWNVQWQNSSSHKMKRNWNVFKKWNVQYNSKMYCPWKLFNYSS